MPPILLAGRPARDVRARVRRWRRPLFAGAGAVAAVLVAGALWWRVEGADLLRARVAHVIGDRLGLDASFDALSVRPGVRLRVIGTGLVLRLRTPAGRPFITIERLEADVGPALLIGHVGGVTVQGLHVNVPPRSERPERPDALVGGGISIDRLDASDVVLTLEPRDATHAPAVYTIHTLQMEGVGLDRTMPFTASLTIPLPSGLVQSQGRVGPWNADDPAALPVQGTYTLSQARLGTIHGIGGTITSTGSYTGELSRIAVHGSARVPDFSLDLGGHPVPLAATFDVVVDGTDGTTALSHVDAVLGATHMAVSGLVDNLPGPGRHDITLTADVGQGRVEDVITLVHGGRPLMTGALAMHARVRLPPGQARERDRLDVSGEFTLNGVAFTAPAVQAKMRDVSRRGQGRSKADPLPPVRSRIAGQFHLAAGVLTLPHLAFSVPGVSVSLAGDCRFDTGALDFSGEAHLQASLSAAVGGVAAIFIKPFNWLFRHGGHGADLPIAVHGTIDEPHVGLRLFGKSP